MGGDPGVGVPLTNHQSSSGRNGGMQGRAQCGVFPHLDACTPSSTYSQTQTPGNSQKFPGTCFQLLHPPRSESPCLASAGVGGGQQLAALAPTMAGLWLAAGPPVQLRPQAQVC